MRFALNRNVFPVTFQQPQREITIKISTFSSLPMDIFNILVEGKGMKCSWWGQIWSIKVSSALLCWRNIKCECEGGGVSSQASYALLLCWKHFTHSSARKECGGGEAVGTTGNSRCIASICFHFFCSNLVNSNQFYLAPVSLPPDLAIIGRNLWLKLS